MTKLKLIYGDALKPLSELEDESVDLILIDPPYGIKYHSNHYTKSNPFDKIVGDDSLNVPIDEMWRILKDDGSCFIFHSFKKPIRDDKIKNEIIWVKNNWSAGDLKGDFGNQYESISFIPKPSFELKSSKRYSNVWHFDRIKPKFHPTEKPIALMKRLIECGSYEDEVVLDCFLGSGTTMKACLEMNRDCIGIEKEKQYIDITKKRLNWGSSLNPEIKFEYIDYKKL